MSGARLKLGGAPQSKQSLRLWLRLLSCSMIIEKRIRQKLSEDFGTTLPRFDVLAALERNPGGLRMGELSDWLLVSNGNVTAIVERLIDEGLVKRTQNEADRRIQRVCLTPLGRKRFAAMAAQHEAWIEHMTRDLGTEDVRVLLGALDRLRTSIERNPI